VRKILFIISSLGCGGAERVISLLASSLCERDYTVGLLPLSPSSQAHWQISAPVVSLALPSAPIRGCGILPRPIRENLLRIRALRRTIDAFAPDAIVSFLDRTNVSVLLATIGCHAKVIVSERGNPELGSQGLPWIWRLLRKLTYPMAFSLVAQTDRAASTFQRWPLMRRIVVIPNPIDPAILTLPPPSGSRTGKKVVALGRLSEEKGFVTLVKAFALIAPRHPEAELWIFGEGPQRKELEEWIERAGLKSAVHLPGITTAPWEELRGADIFALPSKHEGFPNSLLEALALGIPSVASDCAHGPREMSLDGKAALLVPPNRPELFAEALERLMTDTGLKAELASASKEVRRRYDMESILSMWVSLLSRSRVHR
jgi:GalNAc-alpha-(1->4)-GalNAc-alpha-(1->3)-diNAcBac-PP-undecaprenol alpha-1,4-N-acetyl-D-galactosaminyltransferase